VECHAGLTSAPPLGFWGAIKRIESQASILVQIRP
jgi:hypothetical protein